MLEKLGTEDEQRKKDKDNIRTKVQSVGRLLKHLNNTKSLPLTLSEYLTGPNFTELVKVVKELSTSSDPPSLAITLGHYIKSIVLLKISLAIRTSNPDMKTEAKDFKELVDAHWTSKVSSVANRRIKLHSLNKPSDSLKLKTFLENEISTRTKQTNLSYDDWKCLAQQIMIRILLFNKRRISEVEELKILDFYSRTLSGDNDEIVASLDPTEQALVKR